MKRPGEKDDEENDMGQGVIAPHCPRSPTFGGTVGVVFVAAAAGSEGVAQKRQKAFAPCYRTARGSEKEGKKQKNERGS
jgi:hypothetical protein